MTTEDVQSAWRKTYGSDEVRRLTQVNIDRWLAEILERMKATDCRLPGCPLKDGTTFSLRAL